MGKSSCLELGGVKFNADYLRSVSEKKAVRDYAHIERSKVVNAWKQANGKTVRNFAKSEKKTEDPKPKRKRSNKKKSEDS